MAVAMIGPKFYAWDRNGKPLAFGKLYTYQARTNTPKPTYQSEDQVVENTNPVILNGEGYANVYLDGSYKMVLKDEEDNEIWSSDPVSSASAEEWVNCFSAIYVSPTYFKIAGNQTDKYRTGRKVRVNNNQPTYAYSEIKTSTFSGGETSVEVYDSVVLTGIISVCTSISSSESSFGFSDIGRATNYASKNYKDMIEGKLVSGVTVELKSDQYWSSGSTLWLITTEPDYIDIGNGLYLKAISPVYVSDFSEPNGVDYDDDDIELAIESAIKSKITDVNFNPDSEYLFSRTFDLIGKSNLNLKFNGCKLIDDIRVNELPVIDRGAPFCIIYNSSNIKLDNFVYEVTPDREVGSDQVLAPTVAFHVGGGYQGGLFTSDIEITNGKLTTPDSKQLMFCSVLGEARNVKVDNHQMFGGWQYGFNAEYGLAPTDPSSTPNLAQNGRYPYLIQVSRLYGEYLKNCKGFIRTGGTYSLTVDSCIGVNVPGFINVTGGDYNTIRTQHAVTFNNCIHITDTSDVNLAPTAVVTVSHNSEIGGSPLPSWINLIHNTVFNNCEFQSNQLAGSSCVRAIGTEGFVTFNECSFLGGEHGILEATTYAVTYISDRAFTYNNCTFKNNKYHALLQFKATKFEGCKFKTHTATDQAGIYTGGSASYERAVFYDCKWSEFTGSYKAIAVTTGGLHVEGCEFDLFPAASQPAIETKSRSTGKNNVVKNGQLTFDSADNYFIKGQDSFNGRSLQLTTGAVINVDQGDLVVHDSAGQYELKGISGGYEGQVITIYSGLSTADILIRFNSGDVGADEKILTKTFADTTYTGSAWTVRLQKLAGQWREL